MAKTCGAYTLLRFQILSYESPGVFSPQLWDSDGDGNPAGLQSVQVVNGDDRDALRDAVIHQSLEAVGIPTIGIWRCADIM